MRILIAILFLGQFISCSSYIKVQKPDAPAWVISLRDGTQTNKIVMNDKVLYRAISRKDQDIGVNENCKKSVELAKKYVLKEYPFLDSFPFVVEYVYYDPTNNDCSSTISVQKSFTQQMTELSHLKESYEEDKRKIEEDLQNEKSRNRKLKRDLASVKGFIRDNAHLFKEIEILQSRVDQIKNRIRRDERIARNKSITGATLLEMESLFGKRIGLEIDVQNDCYDFFKSSYMSRHGQVQICWSGSQYQKSVTSVLGYCKGGKCWTRSP